MYAFIVFNIISNYKFNFNKGGWSFYLLGSDEEVNRKASEYILKNHPNVKITGRHNGYFNEEENLQIMENIKSSHPDILIVALGSSLANKWIYSHKNDLNAKKLEIALFLHKTIPSL